MSDATLIANDAKNIVQAHLDRLGLYLLWVVCPVYWLWLYFLKAVNPLVKA